MSDDIPVSEAPLVEAAIENTAAEGWRRACEHLEAALLLIAGAKFRKRKFARPSGRDAARAISVARGALAEFYEAKELIG